LLNFAAPTEKATCLVLTGYSSSLRGGKTMNSAAYPRLFEPLDLKGLKFRNRIIMAPLYLGYTALGGKVSPLLLDHYRAAQH
jgi:hypothetical protein